MTPRKYDDKMKLDMNPDEALERFIGVDRAEMEANVRRSKKKASPGSASAKVKKPSGDNIAPLKQRRVRKRTTGE